MLCLELTAYVSCACHFTEQMSISFAPCATDQSPSTTDTTDTRWISCFRHTHSRLRFVLCLFKCMAALG